jgi:diguanylate cyclase (GGDEF)-like protein
VAQVRVESDPDECRPAASESGAIIVESAEARLRLRSVARLARVLAEPRPLIDLLELAGREIRFALSASSVSIGRLERERGRIRTLVNVGELAAWEDPRPEAEYYSVAEVPMNVLLVEELRSYTASVGDPGADPAVVEVLVRSDKVSGVAAPVLLDGMVWGELWATRAVGEPLFEDTDREVAEALAAVLAAGIGQSERLQEAERLINTDVLTGLASRRAIDLALESAIARHRVDGGPVAVVMADVNGLKATNDTRGHEAGDRLITSCAQAVSTALHVAPGALAGRIGGDEFCVVLDGYGVADAEKVAVEIQRQLAARGEPRALALGVASTESAAADDPLPMTESRLLNWADEAQYAAKRSGSAGPAVAGRDAPLTEPVERRSRRRAGTAERPADDRSRAALDAGLRALAQTPRTAPMDRLIAALDAIVEVTGAHGWLIGIGDGSTVRTVAFATVGDGVDVDAPVRLTGAPWERVVGERGIDVLADDPVTPLAGVRGAAAVAAAADRSWWVEVFGGPSAVAGLGAVLRCLVSLAVED